MATGDSLENLEEILKTEEEEGEEGSSDDNSGDEDGSEDEESGDESDEEDGDDEEEDEDGDVEGGEAVDASSDEDDDDEDDDDGDDEEEDGEDENDEAEETSEVKAEDFNMTQSDESDYDGEYDNCPICLSGLRSQDIGTPESCDHTFCLECIQQWAKNVNTCPVDRQVFHLILARHAGKEKVFKKIPVEEKSPDDEEEEDPTYCEVCGQANREDRLLLCDGCDHGYHCECLTPPLAQVPVNAWFCPECSATRGIPVDVDLPRQHRQIGRTLVSDRVRRFIQDARAERAERRERIAAMIEAQEEAEWQFDFEESGPSGVSPSAPTSARKKKTPSKTTKKKATKKGTTKKKTTKKRKTTKRTTKRKKKTTRKRRKTTKGKGKGKRLKKTKKNKSTSSSPAAARTVRLPPPSSVKGRIADRLGLSKPPVGRSIPLQKTASGPGGPREGPQRGPDAGTAALSIRGNKDELYSFAETEGEERQIVNRPAIPAERLLSCSALSSHSRISLTPPKRKVNITSSPASTSSSGCDLLGSILMNQDMLAKSSRHVTINRDGSLSAKDSDSKSPVKKSTSSTSIGQTSASSSSSSSTTSVSDSQNSDKNKRNHSPPSRTAQGDTEDNGPSPKKVCTSSSRDMLKDRASKSDKGLTGTSDTLADSDEELLNFCEVKDPESQKESSDVQTTEPMETECVDIKKEIDSDEDVSRTIPQKQVDPHFSLDLVKSEPSLANLVEDMEDGEASDSNEEGEIRSDEETEGMGNKTKDDDDDDQEEGEIIDEEEKAHTEALVSVPEEELDVKPDVETLKKNLIRDDPENVEFPKDIEQNPEDNVVVKEEKEEEDEESDYDPYDPKNGSFLIASFLHSLVTNEFDRKKEADQKRLEEEQRREEEERKKAELEKDMSEHKISILDFIGNAGARFGVVGNGHFGRAQGRARGRGIGRLNNFNTRRESYEEDMQGGRGNRDPAFLWKGSGYEGEEERMGEKGYFQDRNYRPGSRPDFPERRSLSQRSNSSERSNSRSRRYNNLGEGRKRKREDSVNRGMNGHHRRRQYMKREEVQYKRRKHEERSDRRSPRHRRRRATEESSDSDSGSSSGSESDSDSTDSDSSLIKLSELPVIPPQIPVSPTNSSPAPSPASATPPPPPPPLRSPFESTSPEPPPPPSHPGPGPGNIPPASGPPQHNYAPNHLPGYPHPHYPHSSSAHHASGPTVHGAQNPSELSHAPAAGHASQGQRQSHPPSGYPSAAYQHPRAGDQNSVGSSHPQQPGAAAYPASGYPTSAYPYYSHPHPHPQSHAYPSSYYHPSSSSSSTSQSRSIAPEASTHPSASRYPHYPQQQASSVGYSSTAATAVHHHQHYPASYSHPGHAQPSTTHPYYHAHHRAPVPTSYRYPNRHPYPASTTVGAGSQAHMAHPSQVSATSHHPQYSNPSSHPHPHPSSQPYHPSSTAKPDVSTGVRGDASTVQTQRHFKTIRESPQRTPPKPARLGYRPSPPTVRGVATSDRVASIILHDEVKKGFRQLVEDAVRSALRPAWSTRKVSKDAYKDIFRKCVEKVCGSKETVVQQDKIQTLVDAYVIKARRGQL